MILSYNWIASPIVLYPLALWAWFVVYTVWLEVLRNKNKTLKRRKYPLWLLYLWILWVTLLRSLGSFVVKWFDDHTVEKVVVEEKIIYIPVDAEEEDELNSEVVIDVPIMKDQIECTDSPENSVCSDSEDQWRICEEWRAQDWDSCVKIVAVEVVEDPVEPEFSPKIEVLPPKPPKVQTPPTQKSAVTQPTYVPPAYIPPVEEQIKEPFIEETIKGPSQEQESQEPLTLGSSFWWSSVAGIEEEIIVEPLEDIAGGESSTDAQPTAIEALIKKNNPTSVSELLNR